MYYYGPMDGYGWGDGIIMALIWLLFLVFIVFVVMRLLRHRDWTPGSQSDPIEIAKARYARGEITKEQFEQIKKDLK